MVEQFGSGPSLSQRLDFTIDTTGDLDISRGVSELEKDLSIQMITELREYIGQRPTNNLNARVFRTASDIALADPRVASVNTNDSSISYNFQEEEITLNLVVRTEKGEQTLVFEV